MPHHKEKRILPYRPEQLFDLVADIGAYPQFLPWCKAARITERSGNIVTADLIIGYKMFQEKFTSIVTLERPNFIEVHYKSGPLSHLTNKWEFKPVAGDKCELAFEVAFDFHSGLLRGLMEAFFDKALLKMVEAFEERAKELYS